MKYEKQFNEVIGRDEYGTYYGLEYVFARHDRPSIPGQMTFGACGMTLLPVTVAAAEEARTPENLTERFRDVWKCAVQNDQTEQGLAEWIESNDNFDDESIWDLSFYQVGQKVAEIYNQEQAKEQEIDVSELDDDSRAEFSECTGCGRIFGTDAFGICWDVVYNKELLALALSFESPPQKLHREWRRRLRKIFSNAELKNILDGGPRQQLLLTKSKW